MMGSHAEVACLGEALIDLVSLRAGVGLDGTPGFRKAAGGAPAVSGATPNSRTARSSGDSWDGSEG